GVKYNDYNHRTHREGEIVHTKDGWFQVINGDDTSIDAPPPGVYFWEQDPDNGDYGWDYEKGDGGLTKRDTYFAGIVKDQYFFNWNGKLRTITVLDETDAQKKERLKGKLGEFAYGVTILGLGYSGSSVIGKFGIGKYVAVGDKVDLGMENSAHSVVNYAKYKEVLKTTEKANPLVDGLKQTGNLPLDYITKAQAEALGWKPGKALNNYAPGKQIGGDVFENTTGILPSAPGRVWYEADVGLTNTMTRAKQPGTRLLYSNDGQLYITYDHYETVHNIGTWK
ncbi:ribonuclease domain-containing protein, partial [Acetonema longum]